MSVSRGLVRAARLKVEKLVNPTNEMVFRDMFFQAEIVEQLVLLAGTLTHHKPAPSSLIARLTCLTEPQHTREFFNRINTEPTHPKFAAGARQATRIAFSLQNLACTVDRGVTLVR